MQLFATLLLLFAAFSISQSVENLLDKCMNEKLLDSLLKSGNGIELWEEFIKPGRFKQKKATDLTKLIQTQLKKTEKTLNDFEEGCAKEFRNNIESFNTAIVENAGKILQSADDQHLSFVQLATKYEYPVEEYTVTTRDGYILTIHRIPAGKGKYKDENVTKPVVFLMHGLLTSSVDWIIAGEESSLGYLLADDDYDVWLGNARGNTYSRNHTKLDVNSQEFWDFSWHEIGIIDVTTMIDFVLAKTNQKKLFYVGHSQGATAFYVMCTEQVEYNKKIIAHVSLAPLAFMDRIRSPVIKAVMLANKGLEPIQKSMATQEFLPGNNILDLIARSYCEPEGDYTQFCRNTLFLMTGYNKTHLMHSLTAKIMGHTPAGASSKQLVHYAQVTHSGIFRQFDYGPENNQKYYGFTYPPRYKLNKITTPVYIFYSNSDWLAAKRDVLQLYEGLNSGQGIYMVSAKHWNHLDFIYGAEQYRLVHRKILQLLKKY